MAHTPPEETESKNSAKNTAKQTERIEENISELSHINEAETGFNPTAAELAEVFEGIRKQIKKLGEPPERP